MVQEKGREDGDYKILTQGAAGGHRQNRGRIKQYEYSRSSEGGKIEISGIGGGEILGYRIYKGSGGGLEGERKESMCPQSDHLRHCFGDLNNN